jgi:hypothetical protein
MDKERNSQRGTNIRKIERDEKERGWERGDGERLEGGREINKKGGHQVTMLIIAWPLLFSILQWANTSIMRSEWCWTWEKESFLRLEGATYL